MFWCTLMQDFRDFNKNEKLAHKDLWLHNTLIWCIGTAYGLHLWCFKLFLELDSPRPRCKKKKKAFWMFSQTTSFVFVEARKWYGFGTTWEWVNDDAVFFFWMNYEVSHLDSFGIFLEPHVEVTWHFPLICIFFFFFFEVLLA